MVGVWGLGASPCDAVFPATSICLGPGAVSASLSEIVLMRFQADVTQVIELNTVSRFTPFAARHSLKTVDDAV